MATVTARHLASNPAGNRTVTGVGGNSKLAAATAACEDLHQLQKNGVSATCGVTFVVTSDYFFMVRSWSIVRWFLADLKIKRFVHKRIHVRCVKLPIKKDIIPLFCLKLSTFLIS